MKSLISVAAEGWFEAAAAAQLSRLAPAPPMQVLISSKPAEHSVFPRQAFISVPQLAWRQVSQGPGPPLPSAASGSPASGSAASESAASESAASSTTTSVSTTSAPESASPPVPPVPPVPAVPPQ